MNKFLSDDYLSSIQGLAKHEDLEIGIAGSGPSFSLGKLASCSLILAANASIVDCQSLRSSGRSLIWVVSEAILFGQSNNAVLKRNLLSGVRADLVIAYTRSSQELASVRGALDNLQVKAGGVIHVNNFDIWNVPWLRLLLVNSSSLWTVLAWLGGRFLSILKPYKPGSLRGSEWPPRQLRPSTGVMSAVIARAAFPKSDLILSGVGDFGEGYNARLENLGIQGLQNHENIDRRILRKVQHCV